MTEPGTIKFVFLEDRDSMLDKFHSALLAGLLRFGAKDIRDQTHGRYGVTFTSAEGQTSLVDHYPLGSEDLNSIAIQILHTDGNCIPSRHCPFLSESLFGTMVWVANAISAYVTVISYVSSTMVLPRLASLFLAFDPDAMTLILSPSSTNVLKKILGTDNIPSIAELASGANDGNVILSNWQDVFANRLGLEGQYPIHNPEIFGFDGTVIFDPSYYSFGGFTPIGCNLFSERIVRLCSLSDNKLGLTISSQPMGLSACALIQAALRSLANQIYNLNFEPIHDVESLLDPTPKLVAQLSISAFQQVFLDSPIGQIRIAVWPVDDSGVPTFFFVVFPENREILDQQQGWRSVLEPIVECLECSHGIGSFGESYALLPAYAHQLDKIKSEIRTLFSDGIWKYES